MKKKKVMALLLSTTLTVANITPALAADTSDLVSGTEVTQEMADPVEESNEVSTEESGISEETAEAATEETTEEPQEAAETPDVATQTADPAAIQDEESESLPINSQFEENYLVYKVTGDKEVTVKEHNIGQYRGQYCDVVINPTVEHDGVVYQVSVAENAFMDDWTIGSITIKEGVTTIGTCFMAGCRNVSNVVIEDPNANMLVKDGCVYSSDMTRLEAMIPNYPMESYTTPDSVTVVGSRSIQSKTCKVVTLSDNVTTLEDSATGYMPGTEVFNMGSGITKVANGQFYDCDNLKELNIKGSFMPGWGFVSNCKNLEKVTIDGDIKGSAVDFFVGCPSLKAYEVIHSRYERSVDGVLFNGNSLMRYPAGKEDTSYYIPEGTDLYGQAFDSCQNLETLYVGAGVPLFAGMMYKPAKKMDIYLLDKDSIEIGTKSSYLFYNLKEGSHIYCASEERMAELNSYKKVATSDDGTLPEISVKRLSYTGAKFASSEKEVYTGETFQYVPEQLTPAYANDDLEYTSSNEKICTVDAASGEVTAVAEGECEIRVASKENGETLDSYTVRVKKVTVKNISFAEEEVTMKLKEATKKLNLIFDPVNAETNEGLTWESSDPQIVTVKDGVVTAVRTGTATIVATIQGKTAFCTVHVVNPLEGIQMSEDNVDLKKGEQHHLSVTCTPEDTTDDTTVTWSCSDNKVVFITQYGTIQGLRPGTATVTATIGSFTATCKVTVTAPLESIQVSPATIKRGETQKLKYSVYPADTTDDLSKAVWSSSNPDVVSVDQNGQVTGLAYGTATIKMTVGGISGETEVTVKRPGLEEAQVTLSETSYVYDGTEKRPKVTVVLDGETLKENTDYQIRYANNVKAGTASVTVTGMGVFKGSQIKTYTIRSAGQWLVSGNRWWYRHADGSYTRSGWESINGKWYLFDRAGWMLTGWQKAGGTWYYLDAYGAMVTGWMNDRGTWYYMTENGAMATGWLNLNGTWYFLNGSGAMQTGWLHRASGWYYLTGSGAMATGWLFQGGSWYYLNPADGHMATGWAKVNGKWYYMNGSGAMLTGWLHHGNNWYYLDASGAMATNTWIGNYYVNGSGVWTKTR